MEWHHGDHAEATHSCLATFCLTNTIEKKTKQVRLRMPRSLAVPHKPGCLPETYILGRVGSRFSASVSSEEGTAPVSYPGNNSLLFFLLISGWSPLSQAQETDQGEMGDEARPS